LQSKDLVVAGVLALAVIGSAVGVLTWEEPGFGDAEFSIAWSTETERTARPVQTGTAAAPPRDAFSINVDNLTNVRIEVRLEGAGPRLQQTTAQITLMPPPGVPAPPAKSVSYPAGAGGEARMESFDVPLASIPEATTVRAANESAARANVTEQHGSDAGRGTWEVRVMINPSQGSVETFRLTVTVVAEHYRATITPRTPMIGEAG
jgi:hypothetical protein